MKKHLIIIPLLVSLSLSKEVFANDHEMDFFNDDIPIVLSATRLAQPQTEAPASVTIIDRALIKLSGAKSIAELFRLVPGMHVGYFRGNRAVVGYQGLASEYPQGVQVLIDGRSVYSPLFGGVDWSNLPLVIEDIERIEVIRGPNGSSFGSNAFQSVINISTSHTTQVNGFQVKSTLGEQGFQRTLLRGGTSYEDLDFRVSVSHLDDNGYKNNTDDRRQDIFSGRLDYQITSFDTLQVNIGAVNTLKQTKNPRSTVDPFDPPRQIDESNYSLHTKWEHSTADRQQFTTQFSYTRHLSKDKVNSIFESGNPVLGKVAATLDFTGYYDRYDVEFEHQFDAAHNIRFLWGLGARNDRVMQPAWLDSQQKFDNSIQRVFSNVEWRPNRFFIINAGALWEHSQLAGNDLSPRIAINYLPSAHHSFRFSASHAIRTPVVIESNFDLNLRLNSVDTPGLTLTLPVFNTPSELEPEVVDSIEAGYHGLFVNNTLTLDIKLFRNEFDNLIDDTQVSTPRYVTFNGVPTPPFTIDTGDELKLFDNLYHADISGYEVEINYRPDKNNLWHAGYAYNRVDVGPLLNREIENIRSSVPKDLFNILAAHTFDNNVWLSTAFYYTGSMEYLASGNPQGPMRRLDINTGTTFYVANNQHIDMSLGLQLALDTNTDFLSEFTVDNRAFIEVSYTFN